MSQKAHYEFDEHFMEALDQTLGYTSENIRQRIDARLAWLAAMPDEERTAYLRRTMYPMPLDFTEEIAGTTYAVNAVFCNRSDMTIHEKAERFIANQQKNNDLKC